MFTTCMGPGTPPLETDFCLVLRGAQLLHRMNAGKISFLQLNDLGLLRAQCDTIIEIGTYADQRCFALTIPNTATIEPTSMPAQSLFTEVRALLVSFDEAQLHAVSVARHLAWWNNQNRYCGNCSDPMENHPTERARICPNCNNKVYPVIAPAVIVAISKGDALLLAGNTAFPGNRHSLIAGFVEPGETLEQTVHREIQEEVGFQVHQIQYQCSQPWPFPNSLMVGFTAQWLSGDIQVDGQEIYHADWYRVNDTLPELPVPGSIARRLIDTFFNSQH